MKEIIIGLFNVITSFLSANIIIHYPLWSMLGWKKRLMFIYISCLAFFISICYFIVFVGLNTDIQRLPIFKLLVAIPTLSVSFIIYRKRAVWQFMFLAASAFVYGAINTGIGTFAAQKIFSSNSLLTESILTLAFTALTLFPLLFMLKRLCNNSFIKKAVIFWRYFWLLPAFFFIVTMMTDTYLSSDSDKGVDFVIIRIVLYCALLLLCILLEKAVNQIGESETAKHEAEEKAAEADFYKKMSHQLLTPLTVVSTNIQTIRLRPDDTEKLISKSQDKIMEMSAMINAALSENAEDEESGVNGQ